MIMMLISSIKNKLFGFSQKQRLYQLKFDPKPNDDYRVHIRFACFAS